MTEFVEEEEEIKLEDIKIRYRDVMSNLKGCHSEISCLALHISRADEEFLVLDVSVGVALKSPKDQENTVKGKMIARNRALFAMNNDDRKLNYYNHMPLMEYTYIVVSNNEIDMIPDSIREDIAISNCEEDWIMREVERYLNNEKEIKKLRNEKKTV